MRFLSLFVLLSLFFLSDAHPQKYTISEMQLQTLETEYLRLKESRIKALESVRKSQMESAELMKNSEMLRENLILEIAKTENLKKSVMIYEEEVNSLRTDYEFACMRIKELELMVHRQRTRIVALICIFIFSVSALGLLTYFRVKLP